MPATTSPASETRARAGPKAGRRPARKAGAAGATRTTKPAAKVASPRTAPIAAAPAVGKAAKAEKAAKPAKVPKLHRKPVRDSFTMPEADFSLIATLKARALAGQRETKKSELLRAGLHVLATLDTPTLVKTLDALEPIKIGRPRAER